MTTADRRPRRAKREDASPRLRPLNEPRPVRVETDRAGTPLAVRLGRRDRRVEAVRATWRIDDEWWRASISRRYHDVVLEDGRFVVLYRDLETGSWFAQG